MIRLLYLVVAAYYASLGAFEITSFRHTEGTAVAGAAALTAAAIAVAAAVKQSDQWLAFVVAAGWICVAAFAWSCLDWSAGHDGPAMIWLYIVGPLNLIPAVILSIGVLFRSIKRGRAIATPRSGIT